MTMFGYFVICAFISAVGAEVLNLAEGDACKAHGTSGVCMDIDRCLTDFMLLKTYNETPVICSYVGKDPIVCCVDCKPVENARNAVVNPRGGILWKTGQRAWDVCLEYLETLPYQCKDMATSFARRFYPGFLCQELTFTRPLEGGTDARRGDYPHMALLGYGAIEEEVEWLCGGSVISEHFVLTAAHCIASPSKGPVTYMGLGILKRSDPSSLWQKRKVDSIIRHPKYKSPSKYHDIALLKTEIKIVFDRNTLPACLPIEDWVELPKAEVTGWGALGWKKELADTLQTVELEKFTDEECMQHYPTHRHLRRGYDNETQMCYGDHKEKKDTCGGDSGGPLQITNQGSRCQYTLIGVTSYGRSCGRAGGSGMYTRLLPYIDWIQDEVWPWQ